MMLILDPDALLLFLRMEGRRFRSITALRLCRRYEHNCRPATRTWHLSVRDLSRCAPRTRCTIFKTCSRKGFLMFFDYKPVLATFRCFHFSSPKDRSCPSPNGWTQVDIIVLFWRKSKVDERVAVDSAETVFPECSVVRLGAVPFMLFKSVLWILRRKCRHQPIAGNFCRY